MSDAQAESELEFFRRQWQEEVKHGKAQYKQHDSSSIGIAASSNQNSNTIVKRPSKLRPPTSSSSNQAYEEENDDPVARSYHDLDDKDDVWRLGGSFEPTRETESPSEPTTALEHYEKAVERESAGVLGDSVSLYRKAFRLDSNVHEAYKKKHFPAPPKAASHAPSNPNPSNAPVTVPNTAHHSLHGRADEEPQARSNAGPASLNELLDAFAGLAIAPIAPVIENAPSPPCPIAKLPSEVLLRILHAAAAVDVNNLPHLSLVCKRLAYLVTTEDSLWKTLSLDSFTGVRGMHYRYIITIPGKPQQLAPLDPYPVTSSSIPDLTPSRYHTYRAQFRHRPRLRFGGCYISTVNYTRPGASAQDRKTWNSPIHIVTYYRYLRFFRDGTCISLQTTAEPADVVHYLTREHLEEERRRERDRHAGPTANLPTVVMRDALRGRWRMSGPASGPAPRLEDEDEPLGKRVGEYAKEPVSIFDTSLAGDHDPQEDEGTVHVETEGVVEKYLYKMELALGSAGRGARNNKLSWKGFWSYNRLADDWGEFALKNDKQFYWSRVKSYGLGE